MPWHLYIIECKDSKLYTGITNNLKRRIRDHNSGNGCRYTSIRAPVKLVHSEELPTKSEALKRELRVKHLSRAEKLILIKNKSIDPKPSRAKIRKDKGK
ncbi:MAG: GIY-YIG nuclease family protein [Candidatus Omnitrophica bacterium]|jgi:putative endonuclease|nr:GIY-YIG nuclease family protein [Candidatus Omnitrophota bacterium]